MGSTGIIALGKNLHAQTTYRVTTSAKFYIYIAYFGLDTMEDVRNNQVVKNYEKKNVQQIKLNNNYWIGGCTTV